MPLTLGACASNNGSIVTIVDAPGLDGYTAAVDVYTRDGQFEQRVVAVAASADDNPVTGFGGPLTDTSLFTCHLASVDELAHGSARTVYTDTLDGEPQPNGPVPDGINLSGAVAGGGPTPP
ncbi:MAG: hypothetical protein ACXVRJ_09515 [Gaiellaceae bacterium]